MKWLLTADWQVKFSNLDNAKRAHEQELSIIAKHDIKGHIDLGDLKDDFNPVDVEVIKFQQDRKEAIHNEVANYLNQNSFSSMVYHKKPLSQRKGSHTNNNYKHIVIKKQLLYSITAK